MIRQWIAAHTDNEGLEKAIAQMNGAEVELAKQKKPAAVGPSRGDLAKLTQRLAGGRIQRSKGGRGRGSRGRH